MLFDIGFYFGAGEDFYAVSGEAFDCGKLWAVIEEAEMEREVIDTPVDERAAAGEGFFQ